MTQMTNTNELYHYGVKGMKWGKTKAKEVKQLGLVSDFGRHTSNAYGEASRLADRVARSGKPSKKVKNELSKMSDQELRNRLNRIQMEQQYASLNPSRMSRGASRVSSALATIGSLAAIGGSVASMAIAVKQLMNK